MLIRRINVRPMIVVPSGVILPTNLNVPFINEGSFLEKVQASMEERVAITQLTTEELIALVEKPHLFGIDVIALVGVPGGRYDAVWSSYTAPLRRVSLETLEGEVKKILATDAPTEPPPPLPKREALGYRAPKTMIDPDEDRGAAADADEVTE